MKTMDSMNAPTPGMTATPQVVITGMTTMAMITMAMASETPPTTSMEEAIKTTTLL